jgi:hypothetical protein
MRSEPSRKNRYALRYRAESRSSPPARSSISASSVLHLVLVVLYSISPRTSPQATTHIHVHNHCRVLLPLLQDAQLAPRPTGDLEMYRWAREELNLRPHAYQDGAAR